MYTFFSTFLAAAVVLFVVGGCSLMHAPENRSNLTPDFYPLATDPNTTISVDEQSGEEKVVYDLNGHWKVWLGYAEAVAIIQDGATFVGQTVVGGSC
jgi:hypothetical protein